MEEIAEGARLIRKGNDAVPACEVDGAAVLSAAIVNERQSSCSVNILAVRRSQLGCVERHSIQVY